MPYQLYHGYLRDGSGNPLTDTCDFRFRLWDDLSSGGQVGGDSLVTGFTVINGYFAASVNAAGEFGVNAFTGDARWLEVGVKCGSDAACTTATITTLDNADYVGEFTSLTLSVDGLGLVSYYDATNGALKVAHCSNTFCVPYLRRR